MQNMIGIVILIIVIAGAALLAVGIIDGNRFVTVQRNLRCRGCQRNAGLCCSLICTIKYMERKMIR